MCILTLLNCDIFIASKLLSLPEWLQSLILCCFEVSDFDIQSSAVRTLLDLINLTLSVTAGHVHKDRPSAPVVVIPMISQQSLGVIENSDLYEVRYLLSECNICFWYHQSYLHAFQTYCVTTEGSLGQIVDLNATVDKRNVTFIRCIM